MAYYWFQPSRPNALMNVYVKGKWHPYTAKTTFQIAPTSDAIYLGNASSYQPQDLFNPAVDSAEPRPWDFIPRTQKAKGIVALKQHGYRVPDHELTPIELSEAKKLIGRFVRPCPMTPRHGFVDSRIVPTLEEAEQLIRETRGADPQAELISMPLIAAKHSGIWTPGTLAIGKGNDGATAGTSARTLPVLGDALDREGTNTAAVKAEAGITEAPYLELLWEGPYLYEVQLRNGPELPSGSVDYIPDAVTVAAVVRAEGDLLEWETRAKQFVPGTVVYHPNGSLASHYSVHAVLNRIPVLISREPVIGETLKPNTTDKAVNTQELKSGFFAGCMLPFSYEQAAQLMLAGLHNMAVWKGTQDYLLGVAMGCAYRLTVTACLGEVRYSFRKENSKMPGRESVYTKCWGKVLDTGVRQRFVEALDRFLNPSLWSGGSIGGPKWFEIGFVGAQLYNQILHEPKKALSTLNVLVNSVHNGGWAFNKFVGQHEMDRAARNPVSVVLSLGPIIYDLLETRKEVKTAHRRKLEFQGEHIARIADYSVERLKTPESVSVKVYDSHLRLHILYPSGVYQGPEVSIPSDIREKVKALITLHTPIANHKYGKGWYNFKTDTGIHLGPVHITLDGHGGGEVQWKE